MKTRTIIPNQPFKHDGETYEKDHEYKVSFDDAKYFEAAGWIGDRPETGKEQTLDIHDVYMGHQAEVN